MNKTATAPFYFLLMNLVPLPGVEPGLTNTPFERAAFTNLATGALSGALDKN